MELLDRYLQAVGKHLPWQRQNDILAELKTNLEAQLEDKEAELGRPLTKEETEKWLKQIGPPIRVAARYQRPQYLIGPDVFPTYWYVLRLVLAWATVLYTIGRTVEIAVNNLGWKAAVQAAFQLPVLLLINAAVVTLIFVVVEQVSRRSPEKCKSFAPAASDWSPADLPPVGASDGSKPRTFAKALAEAIFGLLFFVWLLLVPHYPVLILGPGAWYLGASPFALAPAWWPFYWCVVGLNAFELTWKIVDFVRDAWQGPKRARHFVMHVLSLLPLGILLSAPDHALILLKNPAADAAAHGAELAAANKGLHQVVMLVVVIVGLQLAWTIGRACVQIYRNRVTVMP
ncbi:MAG: hypothetical protein ABSF23_09485 [Terracidiphilus sp.]|jgi:hypothetical protein